MRLSRNLPSLKGLSLPVLFLLLMLTSCGEQAGTGGEQAAEKELVKAPEGIITLDQARTDYALYGKRRVPLIQTYEDSILRGEGIDSVFPVARYVAFDYARLKKYMQYIEQEAGKAGTEISSLRIYFGNNPETGGFVHPRQNTVFLLPAARPDAEKDAQFGLYIREDGKPGYLSLDLEPRDANGMGLLPERRQRSEASLLPVSPAPATIQDQTSLILNFGGSAPPPKN
ncbi:hypothetical protein [Robiginitalea sp. SC105]|uniref:hypothetical protein n=1 Tax=Robiginitalea sp. SC105 TaxID=2762332 RepID=UPI00163A4451|nr:hypothetical protein [Robiginitalea sp. SC105]MBC2839772.1 hypothetical protein [Robiginitalea sp. SC105]